MQIKPTTMLLFFSLVLVATAAVLMSFKSNRSSFEAKDYLMITIDTRIDRQHVYVAASDGSYWQEVLVDTARIGNGPQSIRRRFERLGISVRYTSLLEPFKHDTDFRLINKYERLGWKLRDQNQLIPSETTQNHISRYFFTK